jgi:crotonobetaine/carnitine-CoA ligase
MIRRSGENVAAREVEEVLLTHPRIRLVAVTGVPDEIRGEEVKACYVTSAGITDVRPDELAGYCGERLAAFKVPRYWQPATDLPRTDSERVIKERLGELTGPVFDRAAGTWTGNDGGRAARDRAGPAGGEGAAADAGHRRPAAG